jgi:hypothetical protein
VTTLATTMQPDRVYGRQQGAVMVFCGCLADHHPAMLRLDQMERTTRVEPFLASAGMLGVGPTADGRSSGCVTCSPAVCHRPPARHLSLLSAAIATTAPGRHLESQ